MAVLVTSKSSRIFRSIEVSIPACHAGDPGSIPGGRVFSPLRWSLCKRRWPLTQPWSSGMIGTISQPEARSTGEPFYGFQEESLVPTRVRFPAVALLVARELCRASPTPFLRNCAPVDNHGQAYWKSKRNHEREERFRESSKQPGNAEEAIIALLMQMALAERGSSFCFGLVPEVGISRHECTQKQILCRVQSCLRALYCPLLTPYR